ncbi:hypothetical protein [Roseovarius sp. MMSF_3305]|nr:hypothetical protein [Roseovarius sp. MMSF_3305]
MTESRLQRSVTPERKREIFTMAPKVQDHRDGRRAKRFALVI